ncbi:MAG: bifunctional riboflavin kinase/FAD synthetase [Proteobacteria bacterium]|nr:bifunctional riboflavin kinase/FAD synthetase [Pseudomonadota bacterium]
MKIFTDFDSIGFINKPVVTIGNFDGVHRGHQSLIKNVIEQKNKINGTACVITFYPHPLTVINPYVKIEQITPIDDKLKILERLGIDVTILIKFDDSFSSMSAEEFVKKIIWEKLSTNVVIVGYDFAFGKNKEGNRDFFKKMGDELGFEVKIIEPVYEDDIIISSTKIRSFLKEGKIKEAEKFLGRPYVLKGMVTKGKKIGRLIGFPTANLLIIDYLIPRHGVYAAYTYIDNNKYRAVLNIGPAVTFNIDQVSFEVHILDFEGDIYGKEVVVEFVERLRGVEKFKDIEMLKEQIKKDIERAKEILK